MLKPLAAAVAEAITVHGVIKATAVNAGAVPTATRCPTRSAQAELVTACLERAGRDARSVSYVEAHGTGTALGDPIEVAALRRAFEQHTADRQFCAIGSVKSNIGHLESAAGIAGVTKVLMQLRHGRLAPTLHARTPNPEIDFADTPFALQQEPAPGSVARPGGRRAPRLAGISSFGAGGANAHVLIEEFTPADTDDTGTSGGAAAGTRHPVVLSAMDEDRLRERARGLLAALRDPDRDYGEGDLASIAFTLQTGREAMAARLAFMAGSLDELGRTLRRFLDGDETPGLHRGFSPAYEERPGGQDGPHTRSVEDLLAEGEHDAALRTWVRGADADWTRDAAGPRPRRIPLPGYPFARGRYWVTRQETPAPPAPAAVPETVVDPALLLVPGWAAGEDAGTGTADAQRFAHHDIILCGAGLPDGLPDHIGLREGRVRLTVLRSAEQRADRRFEDHTVQLTQVLQDVLRRAVGGRSLVQLVVLGRGGDAALTALSGMLRSVTLENPRVIAQLIEAGDRADRLTPVVMENAARAGDRHVRHEGGERLVARYREATAPAVAPAPWKDHGVYVITGGAGAIGLHLAREIARCTSGARIVLTGRSGPDRPATRDALRAMRELGAHAEYVTADITDRAQTDRLMAEVRSRFGGPNGVIHCAGVLDDAFLIGRTAAGVRRVLAPKVTGWVNLDESTKDDPLDVFLAFSSATAVVGNVGQADYAAANGFMGHCTVRRNELTAAGERHGQALCVHWPLWREGGMRMDEETQERLRASTGAAALETESALQALYRGIAAGVGRLAVFAGAGDDIMNHVNDTALPRTARTERATVDRDPLREAVVRRLKRQLGGIVKLGEESLDARAPLETYGIDSVMITRWNRMLEDDFPDLPRTLFFERRTIAQAADYLLTEFPAECAGWTGTASAASASAPGAVAAVSALSEAPPAPRAHRTAPRPARAVEREPIAIVGITGRYPQADADAVLGATARRRRLHHRDPGRSLGARRLLRRPEDAGAARQELQQMGRVHRRLRRLRPAVLQHLAARSGR